MAKFLNFFPRQLVGGANALTSLYSAPVEAGETTAIETELRFFSVSGTFLTSLSGILESTYDPFLQTGWADYATACTGSTVGVTSFLGTSAPRRFVRAKLTIPTGVFAMISFSARAFC